MEIEKFFFYEERTDVYKDEINKLMLKNDLRINKSIKKHFWFSFENNLYCKICDKNYRQTIFKDNHFIKEHFFSILKKNSYFFLDFEAEFRRFSLKKENKEFRIL